MRITISENTYQFLKDDFVCSERGEFEVKGFGEQTLYFLERELPSTRSVRLLFLLFRILFKSRLHPTRRGNAA